jgi:hypothetical protein
VLYLSLKQLSMPTMKVAMPWLFKTTQKLTTLGRIKLSFLQVWSYFSSSAEVECIFQQEKMTTHSIVSTIAVLFSKRYLT